MRMSLLALGFGAGALVTLLPAPQASVAAADTPPAASAESQRLQIRRSDCEKLIRDQVSHQAAPDVAYQPGVDVRGRPVTPPTLGGGSGSLSFDKPITIDLSIDLFKRYGIPVDPTLFSGEATIGKVSVLPDGRVLFDGKPLGDDGQAGLIALCREQFPDLL